MRGRPTGMDWFADERCSLRRGLEALCSLERCCAFVDLLHQFARHCVAVSCDSDICSKAVCVQMRGNRRGCTSAYNAAVGSILMWPLSGNKGSYLSAACRLGNDHNDKSHGVQTTVASR